ncbi:GlcG/HbpS family heme-binding protein [Rhodopseudomonas palustris]|uniref:GlcG protein n=1 Tax=Rhodopseudomonas palustris (strain BisB18) TaxID=316056 RepID=Q20ZS9_RHOPB
MTELTLDIARTILDAALAKAAEKKLKPLAVFVLDPRGCIKASAAQDGTSLLRGEVAHGKAYGALSLGMGSRAIFQRAQEQAYFIDAVNTLARGALVPVPGGVLIQDENGALLGAVGISGDTSDNDEACAIAGIEAADLKANAG